MKDEPFEKYWQEQFEQFESQPSEGLWDKMSQELFVRQVKMIFNHYFVKPEASFWKKIAIILWFKNFFRFSLTTFNVYYLLTSILLTYSTFNVIDIRENKTPKITSNSNTNIKSFNNARSIQPWLKQQESYISKKDTPPLHTPSKINKMPVIIAKPYHQELTSFYTNNEEFLEPLNPNTINNVGKYTFNENNIAQNLHEYKLRHHAALAFYIAPMNLISNLSILTLSDEKLKSNYQPITSVGLSNFALSAYYEWQKFNFKFQTGLIYSSLKQNYTFNDAFFYNDTLHFQQIIDNSYYNYSYIQVLNLDSLLLTGDTVWFTYVDSTLVPVFDTLNTTEIEMVRKDKTSQQNFKLSVIEVPFTAGYSYSFGKFDLTLKAGTSLSYVLLTKGYLPSTSNDYGVIPFKREQMQNFYINILAGAEANYFISDKLSLSLMPLYRRNVTRLFKNDIPIRLQLQSWTFNIGLKYQLR
ncbi:MAG: hypothetical protein HPY79_04180 [Bacteroidales bacterium]|nr:hypothetical protein [Bacteroidales bacterium]